MMGMKWMVVPLILSTVLLSPNASGDSNIKGLSIKIQETPRVKIKMDRGDRVESRSATLEVSVSKFTQSGEFDLEVNVIWLSEQSRTLAAPIPVIERIDSGTLRVDRLTQSVQVASPECTAKFYANNKWMGYRYAGYIIKITHQGAVIKEEASKDAAKHSPEALADAMVRYKRRTEVQQATTEQ